MAEDYAEVRSGAIQITGAREFRRNLNKMAKGLGGSEMKKVHLDVAKLVERKTAQITPVRSGRLRGSVRGKSTTREATISAGKSGIPYAGVIHFGWPRHNIRPNRFLYRGIAQTPWQLVLEEYASGVDDIAKRAGLK